MQENFCPNCGFQLRDAARTEIADSSAIPEETIVAARNPDALKSLRAKLKEVAPRFLDMSEEDYGEWVNALEFGEFIEFIAMGGEKIGMEIRAACNA